MEKNNSKPFWKYVKSRKQDNIGVAPLKNKGHLINDNNEKEQDKSSDIEQQPPFGDRKISNIQSQNRGWGLQNQQEHHIILTKYEAVDPTAVSENNSSSGMLII